jgi:hypothetical protein
MVSFRLSSGKEKEMKNSKFNSKAAMLALTLISILALAACSTATPAPTNAPMQETTMPAVTAEMTTTQPASTATGGSCLTGTWKISDAVDLIISAASSLTSQGGALSIGNISVTGTAQLIFSPDGTVTLKADNFNENFTANVSGQDFPITVTLQGQESGTYTADGSNVTFVGQAQNTMQETITVSGSETNITDDLLDNPSTSSSYPYSCVDANTLNLQIADPSMTIQPLVLVRVD